MNACSLPVKQYPRLCPIAAAAKQRGGHHAHVNTLPAHSATHTFTTQRKMGTGGGARTRLGGKSATPTSSLATRCL
jgi:hypothetical protein